VPLDEFGDCVCFACQEFPSEEIEKQLAEVAGGKVFFFAALSLNIRQALAEHAPRGVGDEDEDEPVATAALAEDTTWKGLFDSANEAILTGLGTEGEVPAGGEEEE
jgi:hypothetical protein